MQSVEHTNLDAKLAFIFKYWPHAILFVGLLRAKWSLIHYQISSKHIKSGHYRPTTKTPCQCRFAGGSIVAWNWMQAGWLLSDNSDRGLETSIYPCIQERTHSHSPGRLILAGICDIELVGFDNSWSRNPCNWPIQVPKSLHTFRMAFS